MTRVKTQLEALIPSLRRYGRALTGDVTQADDLVQDCLERALSRLSRWQAGSNFRAWVFAIMRNLWVDELRRRGVRLDSTSLDDVVDLASTPPSAGQQGLLMDLRAALALLSAEQREVVLLVGLEGLTYAEVAEVTGVPVGTVMSRLSRGRDRLAQLMQGSGPILRRVK